MPAIGIGAPNHCASVSPYRWLDGEHLRQQAVGNVQRLQQLVVPGVVADVEQHRARRVAHVGGVHAPPVSFHSSHVDGAERQLAVRGVDMRAADLIEQPADLGAAEVGSITRPVERRTCSVEAFRARNCAHSGSVRRSCQTMALWIGAPVRRFHMHRGFALVGDAERRDVASPEASLGERLARHRDLRVPDLGRIVLHPTRLRVDLRELALRHRHDAAIGMKHDGARTRGALVEREQMFIGHVNVPGWW